MANFKLFFNGALTTDPQLESCVLIPSRGGLFWSQNSHNSISRLFKYIQTKNSFIVRPAPHTESLGAVAPREGETLKLALNRKKRPASRLAVAVAPLPSTKEKRIGKLGSNRKNAINRRWNGRRHPHRPSPPARRKNSPHIAPYANQPH